MSEQTAMVMGETVDGAFIVEGGLTIAEALAILRGDTGLELAGSVYVAIARRSEVVEGDLSFATGEYRFELTSPGVDGADNAALLAVIEAHKVELERLRAKCADLEAATHKNLEVP